MNGKIVDEKEIRKREKERAKKEKCGQEKKDLVEYERSMEIEVRDFTAQSKRVSSL